MIISLLKFLKFLVTRSAFLYLIFFLLIWKTLDYQQLINNAVPQTLSRLTPPIDYFSEFVDRQNQYDHFKLMNCINYHKAVAHFFSFQKSEAYGMLGFCYERLGEESLAINSYQQAITINPDYFWPYYNLGVIYYDKSQYSKAQDYFVEALQQVPVKTIFFLTRSKVYNDVKLSMINGSYDFLLSLKKGRREAYELLMESLYKTGSYAQLAKVSVAGLSEGLGDEDVFNYYAGLGSFYEKNLPDAVFFLKAAISKNPNNPDAYYFLGQCLRMAGKDEMAGLLLAKAAGLHQQGYISINQHLKPRVQFF